MIVVARKESLDIPTHPLSGTPDSALFYPVFGTPSPGTRNIRQVVNDMRTANSMLKHIKVNCIYLNDQNFSTLARNQVFLLSVISHAKTWHHQSHFVAETIK